jgi:hypothetical protein
MRKRCNNLENEHEKPTKYSCVNDGNPQGEYVHSDIPQLGGLMLIE